MMQTDEALMQAYQAGDIGAFGHLYRRNAPKVYGYLRKKLSHTPDVDDIFQQIFLKIHRSRDQYDPKYRFEQWLFVIARSVLLDHLKRKRIAATDQVDDRAVSIEEIAAPLSQTDLSSSYTGHSEEEGHALLERLSDEQKQVVKWKVLDDLTYMEIARRVERSEASVRQTFSRAMRKLRGQL